MPIFLMTHYKIHYSNKGAVTKLNTSVILPSAFSVVALISLNLRASTSLTTYVLHLRIVSSSVTSLLILAFLGSFPWYW